MTTLITPDLVALDTDLGTEPAHRHPPSGRAQSQPPDVPPKSKASTPTPWPGSRRPPPASPAASRSRTAAPTAVTEPTLAMARLAPTGRLRRQGRPGRPGLLHRRPEGADQEHLKLLSKLARSLIKKDFTAAPARRDLPGRDRGARRRRPGGQARPTPRCDRPPAAAAAAAAAAAGGGCRRPPSGPKRLVAVTACPTGIAHTYMAADSLVAAGQGSRRRPAGGDPGLLRRQGAGPRRHRRRRRRDLRRRRGRARQGALRRQAGHQRPGQARHRRAGQDGRGGARRRRQPERPPRRRTSAPRNRPSTRPRKRASTSARSSRRPCSPVSAT